MPLGFARGGAWTAWPRSLREIDRASLAIPVDQLLYDNPSESAEASIGARVCNTHLRAISNQFSGWDVAASNAARVQPVGADDSRARTLAVFRAPPAAIAAERAMLQRRLDSGYTASRGDAWSARHLLHRLRSHPVVP
jgi:hypothetical protein